MVAGAETVQAIEVARHDVENAPASWRLVMSVCSSLAGCGPEKLVKCGPER